MRDDNTNPVVKRIAVKADCVFASPAVIGSGFGNNTDNDVLRDADGKPFLPGSSIAGVLRSIAPDTEALFGVADKISPLWVFDAEIKGDIIPLDGVALKPENKVADEQKKYDYEAVATGARFTLRLLLTIRAKDDGALYESKLQTIIGALKSGAVSFGAKTRRGFGMVNCEHAVMREFDLSPGNTNMLMAWINFDWEGDDGFTKAAGSAIESDSETLCVKLGLDGSIMIRDTRNIYEDLSSNEKEPDYKHISIGGDPVILGTSWAGAFRSGLYRLLVLDTQFADSADTYLKEVFGYVSDDDSIATISQVSFGASTLRAADPKTEGYRSITRVKIDRFTGGAADGALFTEKPWYGGETELEIRYPKEREDIRELMILALDAIDKGLIQIGGESAVGRGFFKVLSVNGEPIEALAAKPKQSVIAAIQKAGETA